MRFSIRHDGSNIEFEFRVFDGNYRKVVALIANPVDTDLINNVDKVAINDFIKSYSEIDSAEAEFIFVHHTDNAGNPGRVVVTYNPDTSALATEVRFEPLDLKALVPVPEDEALPLNSFQQVVEYCEKVLRHNNHG